MLLQKLKFGNRDTNFSFHCIFTLLQEIFISVRQYLTNHSQLSSLRSFFNNFLTFFLLALSVLFPSSHCHFFLLFLSFLLSRLTVSNRLQEGINLVPQGIECLFALGTLHWTQLLEHRTHYTINDDYNCSWTELKFWNNKYLNLNLNL